jgi:hypothetical protein
MSVLGKILRFAGYTSEFENNTSHIPLSIEHGRRNTYVAKQYTVKRSMISKKIGTIIYECFISAVILWTVVYAAYMAIRDKDFVLFGRSWFQILVVLQYYHGISYFNKNHFYENIACNSTLKNYIDIVIPIASFIGGCIAIVNVVLLNLGYRFFVYDEIYNNVEIIGKVFTSILLLIESSYTYTTFIINACIFSINMLYHNQRVTAYATDLTDYIKSSLSTHRKLNNVGIEYSQMKAKFNETVTLLTPFFAVLNFVGFIVMYFYTIAITNDLISVPEITNLILFVLIETVYIISIQNVNNNVSNINNILSSDIIIAEYFGNKVFNHNMPIHDIHTNGTHKMNCDHRSVDISVARQVSGFVDRTDRNAFCVPDNDLTDNNQSLHLHTTTNTNEHKEYHREAINNIHNNENDFNEAIASDKFDTIGDNILDNNTMLRHVMIASISNQQILDWMSLRQIIHDKWQTFRIFGVEFTDSTIISKLFGIAIVILISAQAGTMLKWW